MRSATSSVRPTGISGGVSIIGRLSAAGILLLELSLPRYDRVDIVLVDQHRRTGLDCRRDLYALRQVVEPPGEGLAHARVVELDRERFAARLYRAERIAAAVLARERETGDA